jgi:hypothetical protein
MGLTWSFNSDVGGYKTLKATISGGVAGTAVVTKFDGSIIKPITNSTSFTGKDEQYLSTTDLFLSISDTDSGWLEYYKPVADDQLAQFKGWKANGYTAGTSVLDEATGSLAAGATYNLLNTGSLRNIVVEKSSDNVTFASAVEGTDYTLSWNGTTMTLKNATAGALYFRVDYNYGYVANSWASVVDGSAPSTDTLAYVSANQAPNYTPYLLSYVLATAQTQVVTDKVEGDLSISGLAQASVDGGVIVREKARPEKNSSTGYYYLNYDKGSFAGPNGSELENQAEKIIKIYKNSVDDTNNWDVYATGASEFYGKAGARIAISKFDETAEYTATYEVLKSDKYKFTVNPLSIPIWYHGSLSSSVQDINSKVTDNTTQISINTRTLIDVLARLKAGGL